MLFIISFPPPKSTVQGADSEIVCPAGQAEPYYLVLVVVVVGSSDGGWCVHTLRHTRVNTCASVCGGQKSASDAVPQDAVFFGFWFGLLIY